MILRFAVGIVAIVLALIALQATASALPLLQCTSEPVPSAGLPEAGKWIAVAKGTYEVLPNGSGQNTIPMLHITFHEANPDAVEWLDAMAIGVDTNGDGVWQDGVDALHPEIPPATGNGANQDNGWQASLGFLGNPGWALFLSTGAAGEAPTIDFSTEPMTLFWLYQINPDVPSAMVFEPTVLKGFLSWMSDLAFQFTTPGAPNFIYYPTYVISGVGATPGGSAAGGVVAPGATNVPMGDVILQAVPGDGPYSVHGITLSASAGIPQDFVSLTVLQDIDGNGMPDPGVDLLLASASHGMTSESVHLDFDSPIDLGHDGSARIFVLAGFDTELKEGMTYALQITGFDFQPVQGIGITPGVAVVAESIPVPTVMAGFAEGPAVMLEAGPGESVVIDHVQIDAVDTEVVVRELHIRVLGDLEPGVIESVRAWHDVNHTGTLDPETDVALGSTPYVPEIDALITLPEPGLPVASGGRLSLLLGVDVAEGATGGELALQLVAISIDPAVGHPSTTIELLAPQSATLTIGSEDGDADPEFDPPPVLELIDSGAGCSVGTGAGSLAWFVALAGLHVVARRRRA